MPIVTELLRLRHGHDTHCLKSVSVRKEINNWTPSKVLGLTSKDQDRETMLILARNILDSADEKYEKLFEQVHKLQLITGHAFRCYPCREEMLAADSKGPDMRVLDELAIRSDAVHTYRPVTCFGLNNECNLKKQPSVQKRSYSCCADEHVLLIQDRAGDKRFRVKCCYTEDSEKHEESARQRPCIRLRDLYFHQEYVNTFSSFGEMRVFITAVEDPTALRG